MFVLIDYNHMNHMNHMNHINHVNHINHDRNQSHQVNGAEGPETKASAALRAAAAAGLVAPWSLAAGVPSPHGGSQVRAQRRCKAAGVACWAQQPTLRSVATHTLRGSSPHCFDLVDLVVCRRCAFSHSFFSCRLCGRLPR